MPSITQLEYLLAVEKFRHFGKAARYCHVSQPSLSAQIQKLEDQLEIIIFDRSKKPILLTEVGMEILNQAKVILAEHRKLKTLANASAKEPKGEFQLAVIPTLAPYLIPLFLAQFSEKYPKIKLKVHEAKTEDIIHQLNDDSLDAGLLVTPLRDDRLIERHLFFEPFYGYIARDHGLQKKKELSEADLTIGGLWLLEEGHCFRDQVLNICSRTKEDRVLSNVDFESGDLETLKNLIKQSSGYTLLPELAVNSLSKEEFKTYIRKFKKPIPTREVSLVHSRGFLKEAIIEALEAIILASIPRNLRSLKRQAIEIIDMN